MLKPEKTDIMILFALVVKSLISARVAIRVNTKWGSMLISSRSVKEISRVRQDAAIRR